MTDRESDEDRQAPTEDDWVAEIDRRNAPLMAQIVALLDRYAQAHGAERKLIVRQLRGVFALQIPGFPECRTTP